MKNAIIDSCSIINLLNAHVLSSVLSLPDYKFFVSDIVLEECYNNSIQKKLVEEAIENKVLFAITEEVEYASFVTLKNQYHLGSGETESIVLCQKLDRIFVSDDRKARECGVRMLGAENVTGTLFFLKEAVLFKTLTCNEAKTAYYAMIAQGAFLPTIDVDYFCT